MCTLLQSLRLYEFCSVDSEALVVLMSPILSPCYPAPLPQESLMSGCGPRYLFPCAAGGSFSGGGWIRQWSYSYFLKAVKKWILYLLVFLSCLQRSTSAKEVIPPGGWWIFMAWLCLHLWLWSESFHITLREWGLRLPMTPAMPKPMRKDTRQLGKPHIWPTLMALTDGEYLAQKYTVLRTSCTETQKPWVSFKPLTCREEVKAVVQVHQALSMEIKCPVPGGLWVLLQRST